MNRHKQLVGEGRAIFASVLCMPTKALAAVGLLSCVLLLAPSAWAADARIVVNSGNSPYPLKKGKTYTAAEYGAYTPYAGAGSRDGGAAVKVEKGYKLFGENVSFDGNKAYTGKTDHPNYANVYGGAINNEGGTVALKGFTVFKSNACLSTDLTDTYHQDDSWGGAIASVLTYAECDASFTIDGAAAFSNNCASCETHGTSSGGAISLNGRKISSGDKEGTICRSSLVINDNAVFLDNSAVNQDGLGTANGGAISLDSYCDLTIKGDATFKGNSAVAPNQNANGGAIRIARDSTLMICGKAVFDHNTVNGTNRIETGTSQASGGAIRGSGFREITFCDDMTFNGNGHSQGKKCNGGAMSFGAGIGESDPEVSIFNFSGIVELQTATDTWINIGGGYYAYIGSRPATSERQKDPNNYSLKKIPLRVNWNLCDGLAHYASVSNFQHYSNLSNVIEEVHAKLSSVQYLVDQTVTVNADQEEGEYVIASGDLSDRTSQETIASGKYKFIVKTADDATGSAALTVGNKVKYKGQQYRLTVRDNGTPDDATDDLLVLQVGPSTIVPAEVEHATAKVFTNGTVAVGAPYVVESGADVMVVYTIADAGYRFPGGYRTFVTNVTADAATVAVTLTAAQQPVELVPVAYLDAEGHEQTTNALVVAKSDVRVPWNACWFAVTNEVTVKGGAYCAGEVHLILADTGKLTISDVASDNAGIGVSGVGNSLAIYGQALGTGALTVTGGQNGAGIGGGGDKPGSNITINGGTVTATSEYRGAGIGGGSSKPGSYIRINGGTVTATGGPDDGSASGSGIGSGLVTGMDAANNIFVSDDIVLKAGATANPTTEIAHDSATDDIATSLAYKRYATAEKWPKVTVTVPEVGGATAELFAFKVYGGWRAVATNAVPSNATVRVLWTADDGKALTGAGAANAFEWQAEFGPVVGGETAPAPTVSAEGVSEVTIALDTRTKKSYFRAEDILPIWYAAGAEAKVKGEGEQSWETLVKSSATTNTLNWTPTEPDTYTLSQTPLENATIIYALPVEVTTNGLEHADTTFAVADEDGKPLEPQADFGGKLIVASNSTVKVTYTVTTPGLYFANGTTTYTATFTADKSVNDAAKAIADQQPEGPDKPTMKFGVVGQRYPWSSDFDIEYKVTFWPKGSSALGEVLIDGKRIRLFPISPSGAGTYIGKVLTVIPAGTKGKVTVRVVK